MYRLIIVDDEPNTCEILVDFIKEEPTGFEVVGSFSDGKQAWDYIQSNQVDCVITDIKMPNMDGIELAQNIYHSKSNVKVILLSGYRDFEYACQGIKYGVADYQLKPIDYDKLLEVLIRLCGQIDEDRARNGKDKASQNHSEPLGDVNSITMEAALKYIQEHYNEPISRENVADACFMNSAYFGRSFKKYTGYTFTEYLTNLRINKSIQLLSKNISIEEIGEKVGYGSSRHFGRIFKEATGYTPKEYRISILKQEAKH